MTNTRKALLFLAFLSTVSIAEPVIPTQLFFEGSFEHTSMTKTGCDAVFAQTDFEVSHHLVGPSKRTSVVHFQNKEKKGFLHGVSLVGVFGYSNDFQDEHTLRKDDAEYKIVAEGIVSVDLLVMTVRVTKHPIGSPFVLCEAIGEFSAFQ